MTALLAKAGHGAGALDWPAAVVLVAGLACTAAIVVTLILVTARQGAKR